MLIEQHGSFAQAKIFHLKGLGIKILKINDLNVETPVLAGASFASVSILADWRELVCHLYVVYFVLVVLFWGLTRDFAFVLEREICK
jgi:hypothetical protein